jgi:hypothetical protein
MDLMPWILVVQLWADTPPEIQMVYRKEYPNYAACMEARKEWIEKQFVALCGVKVETNKDAYQNLEINSSKTTP